MTVITDDLNQKPRTMFWVVFHDRISQQRPWYAFMLRPGFYHCWVFTSARAGTVILNPLKRTWFLSWQPCDPQELAEHFLADARYRILVIDRPAEAVYHRVTFPNCVAVVKACLGVKSHAITPYQLYRDLLQQGAVEIK